MSNAHKMAVLEKLRKGKSDTKATEYIRERVRKTDEMLKETAIKVAKMAEDKKRSIWQEMKDERAKMEVRQKALIIADNGNVERPNVSMSKAIDAENAKYDLPFMRKHYNAIEKHLAELDSNGNCDPDIYAVYKQCLIFMNSYLKQFGK